MRDDLRQARVFVWLTLWSLAGWAFVGYLFWRL